MVFSKVGPNQSIEWGQIRVSKSHAKSLREICGGLAASEGKLRHLGLPQAPARATLAYANEHRPWQLYRTVFDQLLARCQAVAASQPGTRKKKKFRFKSPLMSLDASVIDLCASMFDWAKFRLTKGAVKLHLLLDHDGYLPSFAVITEGKKHEVRVARQMRFTPGTILVFDRGLHGLRVVCAFDAARGLFRDPPERKRRLLNRLRKLMDAFAKWSRLPCSTAAAHTCLRGLWAVPATAQKENGVVEERVVPQRRGGVARPSDLFL